MSRADARTIATGRRYLVVGACAVAALVLAGRAIDLQVLSNDFLQRQGAARHVRTVPIPAHRGMIVDRHGDPLAISTPLWSIWAVPEQLLQASDRWDELAAALGMAVSEVAARVRDAAGSQFVWLQRRMTPVRAEQVMALHVPGVHKRREYRRYYPTGEVFGQVIGFTGIDNHGLEGLELAYDDWLSGRDGIMRVVQDRLGRVVEALELVRPVEHGRDLRISLDRRLQYLAFRELKAAVERHDARGGSLVVLDVHTGEVLAMVNQPAFNPNDISERSGPAVRNRAVTDVFEPGSTMKTLTIAAALETGAFEPDTLISTAPGHVFVGGHKITDHRNLGLLDVAGVIRESSNVGSARIALSLKPYTLWSMYAAFGLGVPTGSGFPGEASGTLRPPGAWGRLEQAIMAFGYGVSVTALQLARAYATIAAGGVRPPVTFRYVPDGASVEGKRVISRETAAELTAMLESVVQSGTGYRAAVPGYRVAGKTGTAHKFVDDSYAAHRYRAIFAGFAPVSDPRIAVVVMIDEPTGAYYSSQVAAPVFSHVVAGAMRILGVPPDAPDLRVAARADGA